MSFIIGVDVRVGDPRNDPKEEVWNAINGILVAQKDSINQGVQYRLYGDTELIQAVHPGPWPEGITLQPTTQVISMDTLPLNIRQYLDSPIVRIARDLKSGEITAGLSAGNSGCIMAAYMLFTGLLERGLDMRPPICALLPNIEDGVVGLTDVGANIDPKPEWFPYFAVAGQAYVEAVTGQSNPPVYLLGYGEEEHKLDKLGKEAKPLLVRAIPEFRGVIDPREVLSTNGVVVGSAFPLNIGIKMAQAAVNLVMEKAYRATMDSLDTPRFDSLKQQVDFRKCSGEPLLLGKGIYFVLHGASTADTYTATIPRLKRCVEKDLVGRVAARLQQLQERSRSEPITVSAPLGGISLPA